MAKTLEDTGTKDASRATELFVIRAVKKEELL
jgi:hypothetical protein